MQKHNFVYTIVRSRRKSVAIRIKADGTVSVLCPLYLSAARIEEIVRSKAAWIEEKLRARENLLPVVPFSQEEIRTLTLQAQKELPPRIAHWAAQMGVHYECVTIRHQKTRWGSCSGKGNLNFNCLLMLSPPEVRDYIIVHELCHLKEMNHSFKFRDQKVAGSNPVTSTRKCRNPKGFRFFFYSLCTKRRLWRFFHATDVQPWEKGQRHGPLSGSGFG